MLLKTVINWKGEQKMSNDISTMYTKDRNMKSGRKGYGA